MRQNLFASKGFDLRRGYARALPFCEALTIVLVLVLIHRPMAGHVPERYWLFMLQIGTSYSVWRGGWKAGLITLALSTIIAAYFYLPPKYSLEIGNTEDTICIVIYLILGIFIIGIGGLHQRRYEISQEHADNLQKMNKRLERLNNQLDLALQKRNRDLMELKIWAADEYA